ncbi:branched-chain-amino-acid aminotransferase 6-like [Hibiscus syriacus]|uniref:branched-chain-amino-acid aminotransferase 6-like n=1 Tax=Hibiscus syriacus TaxID=106335 RepID=UPI0019213AD2|nr:branched-chain-amino-acid aminotransferase 6-like [Hibiscus syriacus]
MAWLHLINWWHQGLFEGLKAYRKKDEGILFFRPEENALRMKMSADRMCMTSPTVEQFIDAVKKTVLANKRWLPPHGRGSLYIRPLLIGTGQNLGLKPSSEYTFLVYASPVGIFNKGELNLKVENKVHRATPGGTGGVKAVTNYSPVYKPLTEAKAEGFSDVLFLDALTRSNIEEGSVCNIFVLKVEPIRIGLVSRLNSEGHRHNHVCSNAGKCYLNSKSR